MNDHYWIQKKVLYRSENKTCEFMQFLANKYTPEDGQSGLLRGIAEGLQRLLEEQGGEYVEELVLHILNKPKQFDLLKGRNYAQLKKERLNGIDSLRYFADIYAKASTFQLKLNCAIAFSL